MEADDESIRLQNAGHERNKGSRAAASECEHYGNFYGNVKMRAMLTNWKQNKPLTSTMYVQMLHRGLWIVDIPEDFSGSYRPVVT